jgi:hypothetical protein
LDYRSSGFTSGFASVEVQGNVSRQAMVVEADVLRVTRKIRRSVGVFQLVPGAWAFGSGFGRELAVLPAEP